MPAVVGTDVVDKRLARLVAMLVLGWCVLSFAIPVHAQNTEGKPVLNEPVTEGSRRVSGHYAPSGKTDKIIVHVDGAPVAGQVTFFSAETRTFEVELRQPLAARALVQVVHQIFEGDAGLPEETRTSDQLTVRSSTYDWGRSRAEFAFGAVFSKEREEFSKTDLYLDFLLDASLIGPDWDFLDRDALPEAAMASDTNRWQFLLNGYVSIGLTSVPVAPDDGEGGEMEEMPEPEEPPTDLSGFLASRKAAAFEFGVYAPIFNDALSWTDGEGRVNAFFFAPILKAGLQSITEEVKTIRDDPDDLFENWSFGARLGHLRLRNSVNTNPEMVSYLDVTFGRWENFERCEGRVPQPTPMSCGEEPAGGTKVNPMRLGIVGRLKIPRAPLILGFDINSGADQDDMRFLLATRFDIARLFDNLTGSRDGDDS